MATINAYELTLLDEGLDLFLDYHHYHQTKASNHYYYEGTTTKVLLLQHYYYFVHPVAVHHQLASISSRE